MAESTSMQGSLKDSRSAGGKVATGRREAQEVTGVYETYEPPEIFDVGDFVELTLGGNGSQADSVSYENGTI